MRSFSCAVCGQTLFFENVSCVQCGSRLAYLPEVRLMAPLEEEERGLYRALIPGAEGAQVRLCANAVQYGVCNWAVPAWDPHDFCQACRLNQTVPDVSRPETMHAWLTIESAKRRLLYTLTGLGLPLASKTDDPRGLAFAFEKPSPDQPVFTGHSNGLITINLDEADDPFREKQRVELGEFYRTVLGHFRHEIGHYYWLRLIEGTPRVDEFRALFGDERIDYSAAKEKHYESSASCSWRESYISAYATMHPWEDWAECFAHYLHMIDTLETAQDNGLALRPQPGVLIDTRRVHFDDFDELLKAWYPLTIALNDLNRSMGQPDLYPFVLPAPVLEKLRFIDGVVFAETRRETVEIQESTHKEALA